MEIVDKRRKTDEWHVGDVICYYNLPDNKNYGMIMAYECDEDIDANNLYCLVGIDRNAGDVEVYDSPSIEDLRNISIRNSVSRGTIKENTKND